MSIKVVTKTTTEPVSLQEAKTYLRVDYDHEDNLISNLITRARDYVESRTGRQLTTSTLETHLDNWPSVPCLSVVPRSAHPIIPLTLPLTSVSGIQYRDSSDNWQLLPSGSYITDTTSGRVQVTQVPSTSPYLDAIKITYSVGSISDKAKQLILLVIDDWYNNRGASTAQELKVHPSIDRLMWLERDLTLA